MTAPSSDMASEAYNKIATSGGASDFSSPAGMSRAFDLGVSEIDAQVQYLTTFTENLKKALGITVTDDEGAAKAAEQAGKPKAETGGYL
jgi:hypothetical protein